MPYPDNQLVFFDPRLGPLFTYYQLGVRALEWAVLIEQVILTRIFIANFVQEIKYPPFFRRGYSGLAQHELLRILKFLLERVEHEHYEFFYSCEDVPMSKCREAFSALLSSALAQVEDADLEEKRDDALFNLRRLLWQPLPGVSADQEWEILHYYLTRNVTLYMVARPPGFVVTDVVRAWDLLHYYISDPRISWGLPTPLPFVCREPFSPHVLSLVMAAGFYERIARLWLTLFVLASRYVEEFLVPWAQGSYCYCPFSGEILGELGNFYDVLQVRFKNLVAIAEKQSQGFTLPRKWQEELFEDQVTCNEVLPSSPVLPHFPGLLEQLESQRKFLNAIAWYAAIDSRKAESEKSFGELREKVPLTFPSPAWGYLVDKYPLPDNPTKWPWPMYWS